LRSTIDDVRRIRCYPGTRRNVRRPSGSWGFAGQLGGHRNPAFAADSSCVCACFRMQAIITGGAQGIGFGVAE